LNVERDVAAGTSGVGQEASVKNTSLLLQANVPDLRASIEIVSKSMSEIGSFSEFEGLNSAASELNTDRTGAPSRSSKSIRNLNEQKRKIELDEAYDDESESRVENEENADENVNFTFKKRRNNEGKYRKKSD
jgi:hypothetical protein